MGPKTFRYVAKLFGPNTAEEYVQNLVSDRRFDLRKIREGEETVYEVYGPLKNDDYKSLEYIRSDLSDRAEELGFNLPGIVEKVSRDILTAQDCERIVLSQPMQMTILASMEGTEMLATLDVTAEDDPDTEDCIHGYCSLRFVWLADAMGATLEGAVEKHLVQ